MLEQQVVVEVLVLELSLPRFVVPELIQTKAGLVVEPELARTKSEMKCPKLVLLGLGLGLDRTRFDPVNLVANFVVLIAKMGIVEGMSQLTKNLGNWMRRARLLLNFGVSTNF